MKITSHLQKDRMNKGTFLSCICMQMLFKGKPHVISSFRQLQILCLSIHAKYLRLRKPHEFIDLLIMFYPDQPQE